MSATGGPIKEVSIRGRIFSVAEASEAGLILGGQQNEVAMNGDASARRLVTIVPWSVNNLDLQIDHVRRDLQFLNQVARGDFGEFVPMTVTLVNDITYMGKGQIVGEVSNNTKQSTAGVTLSGPGEAEAQ